MKRNSYRGLARWSEWILAGKWRKSRKWHQGEADDQGPGMVRSERYIYLSVISDHKTEILWLYEAELIQSELLHY